MKRLLFGFAVLCSVPFNAQGIYNNGAYIVCSGAAQIYIAGGGNGDYLSTANGRITPAAGSVITMEGDWTNNAGNTGFTADAGTVIMNGAAQSINGTASTTFYNLTLQGTNTKTLNVNTSVGGVVTTTGVLSLGTRPLDLNSRYLTITNSATAAVTYTTGYVLSETNAALNPSIMRWNTGAFSASYVFPFGSVGGTQIPLTFNKTVATASNIDIATRPTAGSANLPWAAGVTHMYDPNLAQDGSDEAVIDRWWEITASTAVTADITFRYLGTENTLWVPYNTGNIGAQYWAAAWLPNNATIGSTPAVLAGVGAHLAAGLSITTAYTPWVLSSVLAPLPVELVRFESDCNGSSVLLQWATASELNNDYFTIQRSDDGVNFRDIDIVDGNGTTSQLHNYSYTDNEPFTGTAYYRLKQTDFNGQESFSEIRPQSSCLEEGEFINAFSFGNDLFVEINAASGSDFAIDFFDVQGKLIFSKSVYAEEGYNRFVLTDITTASGVYFVRVYDGGNSNYSKRVTFTR